MDPPVLARRPDYRVNLQEKKRTCHLVNFAVPAEQKMEKT